MSSTSTTPVPGTARAVVGGGIGGALGFLVVLFMPDTWHTFTPETASAATAAFGVVFSYLIRYLPQPPR